MLQVLLPVLRADFHLCGTYRWQRRTPLDMPILALRGTEDEISAEPENLTRWSLETTGPFRLDMFEGGHFFIDQHRQAVVDRVAASLAEACGVEAASA